MDKAVIIATCAYTWGMSGYLIGRYWDEQIRRYYVVRYTFEVSTWDETDLVLSVLNVFFGPFTQIVCWFAANPELKQWMKNDKKGNR